MLSTIVGRDLGSWLKEEGVPGIEGIDTRALTKVTFKMPRVTTESRTTICKY